MDTLLLHKVFRILCFGKYLSRNTRIRTNNACFYCFYAYTRKIFCAGIFSLFFALPLFFFLYSRASTNSHRRIFIYVTPSLSLSPSFLSQPSIFIFLSCAHACGGGDAVFVFYLFATFHSLYVHLLWGNSKQFEICMGIAGAELHWTRDTPRGIGSKGKEEEKDCWRGLKE